MTGNEHGKGSLSNEPDGQDMSPRTPRGGRLSQFLSSSPKAKKQCPEDRQSIESDRIPLRRASTLIGFGFWRKQKLGMEGNNNESTRSSKSLRTFFKTKTFSDMFRSGKGKSYENEVAGEPKNDFVSIEPRFQAKDSSPNNHQPPPEEENPSSISKSDRLRSMKESIPNRTIVFRADLPPCSPLSTKQPTSCETGAYNGSKKSDESEAGSRRLQQPSSNGETSPEKRRAQNAAMPETQSTLTSTDGSKTVNSTNTLTLLKVRFGSTVFDEGDSASGPVSSPLGSSRRMHRRSSSLPNFTGQPSIRSKSSIEENYDGTKKAVRNDYESPWGVTDCPTSDEGGNRQSSRSARVSGFVIGLKGRKATHHSSDSFQTDDDSSSWDKVQPVSLLEDEFINFTAKHHSLKNNRKGNRNKIGRGRYSLSHREIPRRFERDRHTAENSSETE